MKFKILIVVGNYYKEFSKSLLFCAKEKLKNELKVKHKSKIMKFEVDDIEVPGSFEVPIIIARNIKKYDGFIALGCIIKGETQHFEFISQSITNAIMQLSIDHKKPIGNGIITCLNKEQANDRSSAKRQEAAEPLYLYYQNKMSLEYSPKNNPES